MKLSEQECRTINTYFEYLDHIRETRILQATHHISDEEAEDLSKYIAACLTVKKEEKPVTIDPFA